MEALSVLPTVGNTDLINDPEEVFGLVHTFSDERATEHFGQLAKARTLDNETRDKLYKRQGKALSLAQKLLNEVSPGALVDVLAWHGLSPARQGTNQFRPLTDMLWGEWKVLTEEQAKATGDKKKWKTKREIDGVVHGFFTNRSTEKYAKGLRFAAFKGWTEAQYVEQLAKRKLDGINALDTKEFSSKDEDLIELEKYRTAVLKQAPTKALPRTDLGIPTDYGNKYAAIWGNFDADGNFCVMGMLPQSDDVINGHITKVAKATGKDLYIKQLEAEKTATATASTETAPVE